MPYEPFWTFALITPKQIRDRMIREIFNQALMENSFRGIWCEYMVAEALGSECKTVGTGWHAWDLQIGESKDAFPQRIRIQVKNSARLQSWNAETGIESKCQFNLTLRKRPSYFEQYNVGVPCEEFGFLCDLYILCLHDDPKRKSANHGDPAQWKFFLLPVVGPKTAVTEQEFVSARRKFLSTRKPTSLMRRPETLPTGIRGRPAIEPIGVSDLTINKVREVLGVS